jgi:type IV pilus assembly protein PilY1
MKLSNLRAMLAGAILVAAGALQAAPTDIAQLPLLNMTGTGAVKPNIMLLFDNSGSMGYDFTPDYVQAESLCRSGALYSTSTPIKCDSGHPPFNSPDFNKQYYNPAIRYKPPIKADGSYYAEMNRTNTSVWSAVNSDVFLNTNKVNLIGNTDDLEWCSIPIASNPTASQCRQNTAGYTYPDNTYLYARTIKVAPYYYNIGVSEYCTDKSLKTCRSVAAGGNAPSGYTFPSKVRWCDSITLRNCQAKRVGAFVNPRFSEPTGTKVSYSTVAIGNTSNSTSRTITSVTVPDGGTQVTITNGPVVASGGTDTAAEQQAMASALAASIIARTIPGTAPSYQYWACVRTPVGTTVAPCADYGIALGADNVVAIMVVLCDSPKSAANCLLVSDSSRSGNAVIVNQAGGVPSTALLNISGTTNNSNSVTLNGLTWSGIETLSSPATLGKSKGASTVAAAIVAAINANPPSGIFAYVGSNSITPVCAAKTNTSVCLVDFRPAANTTTPVPGSVSNNNGSNLAFGPLPGAGFTAGPIPITLGSMIIGSAPNPFSRVNIVSTVTSYPKGPERPDCAAAASCTFDEEMTNYANWYAYYRTRLLMMKTAVGQAFAGVTANYRVGFTRLSDAAVEAAISQTPADFTGTSRTSWYSLLYGTGTNGSTPMRPAMHAVGKMFSNLAPYVQTDPTKRVVTYPCQQNFMIVTTDGYWNGGTATGVANNDNVENKDRFCTASRGCVDKNSAGTTISDVALYWYNGGSATGTVSLIPSIDDITKPGSVAAASGENTHLHVNTFTLGLGMEGEMDYDPNYDGKAEQGGDFANLINGVSTGCPWNNGGAYAWPDPKTSSTANTVQARVDDLWHAAINGHGKYFSASKPGEVVAGLAEAFANIQIKMGAAAAAATSTPNISVEDNDLFSDTFTTVKWYGELAKRKVDVLTGAVGTTPVWISSDTVGTLVGASSDTRTIYMLDTAGAAALKPFKFASMNATEKTWFSNQCMNLAQCTLRTTAEQAIINDGNNMVDWLRGQQQYADARIFRDYTYTTNTPAGATGPIPIVLGDIASSKPAYLRDSRKSYSLAGHSDFRVAAASRAPAVFAAANDGMLHAFDARTGTEMWAYAPRITMKKLARQASTDYGTNHQYTTDGSPELSDVQIGGVWKTLLVAGLNAGGRGYYALDVTDPANPVALWERCADAAICPAKTGDTDTTENLGLSFGNPQIGMWRGKWVVFVTSGYNNIPGVEGANGGDGKGYLYILDAATGVVLKRISTGSGDPATPSGLARITAISPNPFSDPVITYIYGGDLLGQMWRFDLTDTATDTITVLMMGSSGVDKPITSRPDVTQCLANGGAQRVVVFGTGRMLAMSDITDANPKTQSLFMLKDTGVTISNIHGGNMIQQVLSNLGSSTNSNTYTITSKAVDLGSASVDGWYFDWSLNAGERLNLDPKIVGGAIDVVTNIPTAATACNVGGSSNIYQVDACTGSYVSSDKIIGETLSSSSGAVGNTVISLSSGAQKDIVTLADGRIIEKDRNAKPTAKAHKVGWRRVRN